jgi:O-antigen/teichoic acid export membrane protein
VAEIVAALAGATYYVYILRQLSIAAQLKVRFSQIVARVSSGASVGLSNVVWAFMMYVPISLATNLSTGSEAAWIAGAQRIVVALVSFSALYFFNLYPLMVRGLSDDRARWSRLMGSSFRLIAWSSLGLALCGTLAAEAIVVAAFGAPFAVAAPVFSIYIWLLPLRLLSGHARWTLIAAERQRVLLIVELLTTAMLVALGTVLVPTYGAIGAAVSVIGANVGGWIAAHVAVQRYVGPLPAFGPVALPGVAAVLGGGLAYFLKDYTIIGPALAVGLYVVCMAKSAPGLFADAVRLAHAKTPPA